MMGGNVVDGGMDGASPDRRVWDGVAEDSSVAEPLRREAISTLTDSRRFWPRWPSISSARGKGNWSSRCCVPCSACLSLTLASGGGCKLEILATVTTATDVVVS